MAFLHVLAYKKEIYQKDYVFESGEIFYQPPTKKVIHSFFQHKQQFHLLLNKNPFEEGFFVE
jgi:hypothetical protein